MRHFLTAKTMSVMQGSMKVKVIKENASRVTIKLLMANAKMPVPRDEFEKRVKDGTYEVVD